MVLRYEGYEERCAGPVLIRELPGTFVPIIVDLDAGWSVSHRQHRSPRRLGSFVAGITDGPVLVGHAGSARCVQVDLTPKEFATLLLYIVVGVPGVALLLGVAVWWMRRN